MRTILLLSLLCLFTICFAIHLSAKKKSENPERDFLDFVRKMSNDSSINYDKKVYASEKANGFRNHATACLLKSLNNLHNDIGKVLNFYYLQCSLCMSCEQLSKTFYCFMNGGKTLLTKSF